jgi:hypothetical protein
VVLQCRQELFGFRERQAEVLDLLACLIENDHLLDSVFLPILCTHAALHLEPPRAILLSE